MKNHITSKDLSIKLKELGVPQMSKFYYEITHGGFGIKEHLRYGKADTGYTYISAYLATELLEMLPRHIQFSQAPKEWLIGYAIEEKTFIGKSKTMQDALAEMLIQLIEEKIIDVKSL